MAPTRRYPQPMPARVLPGSWSAPGTTLGWGRSGMSGQWKRGSAWLSAAAGAGRRSHTQSHAPLRQSHPGRRLLEGGTTSDPFLGNEERPKAPSDVTRPPWLQRGLSRPHRSEGDRRARLEAESTPDHHAARLGLSRVTAPAGGPGSRAPGDPSFVAVSPPSVGCSLRAGGRPHVKPSRRAIVATSTLDDAPSLALMLATWTDAVFLLITSELAISPSDMPDATSASTSCSRGVRLNRPRRAGVGRRADPEGQPPRQRPSRCRVPPAHPWTHPWPRAART